jgi:hypothetical protein
MTNVRIFGPPFRGVLPLMLSGALALCPLLLVAQMTPTRLPDKDVKALIEQVGENRDKFNDNLAGDIKSAKIRRPDREVDVSAFLDDYKENINKLKDRFTDDYSASSELAEVLRQGTAIDAFMKNSPVNTKGRSEWDREAASLKSLAQVYGTTFPTPDGAPVRRINDKETAAAADALANSADHFKNNLDKDSTIPAPQRDAAKKDAEALKKLAETVKSRTEDGKPASAEFQQLTTQMAKVQSWVDMHPVPAAAADWQDAQKQMTKLRQAFGMW